MTRGRKGKKGIKVETARVKRGNGREGSRMGTGKTVRHGAARAGERGREDED